MILVVDDELHTIENYLDELTHADFEISQHRSVDSALRFFTENQKKVEMVVLDIMMPPSHTFPGTDTNEGLLTGADFFKHLRESAPTLPVIFFTNRAGPEVLKPEIDLSSEPNTRFISKKLITNEEFVDEVSQMLGTANDAER